MSKYLKKFLIIYVITCCGICATAQVRLAAGYGEHSFQEYNTDVTEWLDAAIRYRGYDWVYDNIYANQLKARDNGERYPYIYFDVFNDGSVEIRRIERLQKCMNDSLI